MKIIDVDATNFQQIKKDCQSCTYWHECDAADPTEARRSMFANARLKGKLAVDDSGTAIGFVQYGPLELYQEFARLRQGFGTELIPGAWVITCLSTDKGHRGKGIAKALVAALIDEASAQGCVLEASGMEDANFEQVSVGPAELYRQLGFQELARFRDKYGVNVLLRK